MSFQKKRELHTLEKFSFSWVEPTVKPDLEELSSL